ncbi:chromosome transmission fidelity 8 -like protein [Brachionus plicatilis]|uniref:Chromosome transmission fidelity 8-like protein n=1 Tax=Brachionus plicatilis TaxID=10195 RepID=A0A3M7T951_BRAPC|nr:chromosome transmission fidelity 8 -like protein [Brachionus plicatilis]
MVQIFIKTSQDTGVTEWSLIEIQGDLECENGKDINGKFMADLYFNTDGTPILILGHHIMYGKVCNLEKPMVLIRKQKIVNKDDHMQIDDVKENAQTEYNSL